MSARKRKDQAHERLLRWKRDPISMVREEFGVEPDKWQAAGLRAFADPEVPRKRLAFQACAGPGKSAELAWCGLNFMGCYGEEQNHPNGAVISITAANLKNNLWKEFSVWIQRSEFFRSAFGKTSDRIFAKDHPDTWFLMARSFPETADPQVAGEALSGFHAKYLLYLIDESGSMPPAVAKRAEQGLMSADWCRILQAGNPTSQEGLLYDSVANHSALWEVVRITGDPDDPHRSPRINKEEAQNQIREHGRDDPWVQAYILGLFPKSALNTLLTPDEVREAMARKYKDQEYTWSQKRLGIDVARFGLDRTVIFPRQGLRAFRPVEMRGANGPQIAARVAQAKETWHSEMEFLDSTGGWGMSAIDQLRTAGYAPVGVEYHLRAINPKYHNRRVEMWMEMAKWVKRGGWLPNIPSLVAELTTPTYTFHNGQYLLQDKDSVKKILGRSPDLADALGLTFAMPDMPGADTPEGTRRRIKSQKRQGEYDPFAEQAG